MRVVPLAALVTVAAIAIGLVVGARVGSPVVPAAVGQTVGQAAVPPAGQVVRPSPAEVGYVGDSITDQARRPLVSELGADPWRIVATPGKTIEQMLVPAHELAATAHPDRVIINLGTNNVLGNDPLDGEVAALHQMTDVFGDARCIGLVTINEHMIRFGDDLSGEAHRLNDAMRAMAAADPKVRVIDWAQIVIDYDAAGDPDGPVTTDTVHPAPAGQQRLLDAYRSALDSC
jgi:hypothetical protein